jgi:hypothetical protein
VHSLRDQVLGTLDTALVPGAAWFLPDADDESSGIPESSLLRREGHNLLDLETVLEEIAAEIAAPRAGLPKET